MFFVFLAKRAQTICESAVIAAPSAVTSPIVFGVAKLKDRSAFAGSIATADRLVRTCVQAGIDLADSIKMLTQTPAAIMGLANKGILAEGYDADIVIFNENIDVQAVFVQGEQLV